MQAIFEVPGSIALSKSAGADEWVVGGIASGFLRDLDGDAIAPDAVSRAIPSFMAKRGEGVTGGPLRLHHGFWDHFLRQAIDSLFLPGDEKKNLVAAIALPLGRVTKIWVDEQGRTHWRGVLSKVNPIARIIWQMLREGAVHLGVSLGGKILGTRPGVDARGRVCTVIDDIRLDEISITDNPAYRITDGEDSGAYIAALAKSAQQVLGKAGRIDLFLRKALSASYQEFYPDANLWDLLKAAKYDLTKPRTDDKGRVWEFNQETRRWRLKQDGKTQPKGKKKRKSPDGVPASKQELKPKSNKKDAPANSRGESSAEGKTVLGSVKLPPGVGLKLGVLIDENTGKPIPKKDGIPSSMDEFNDFLLEEYPATYNTLIHQGYIQEQRDKDVLRLMVDLKFEQENGKKKLDLLERGFSEVREKNGYRDRHGNTFRKVANHSMKLTKSDPKVERFLHKALSDGGTTVTGIGKDTIGNPKFKGPGGGSTVQMDAKGTTTGMNKDNLNPSLSQPKGGTQIPTDVWGMTVRQFTRELSKACDCEDKEATWKSEDMRKALVDGAYGMTTVTDNPPEPLVGFVRFLQYLTQFAQALPSMDRFQATGTIDAMTSDLRSMIDGLESTIPAELLDAPFAAPSDPRAHTLMLPSYSLLS